MFTLNCKGKLFAFNRPIVMGILNATSDSFYEGSRFTGEGGIIQRAGTMVSDGATIIDIGGQSTRPGSERIAETEEMDRVCTAIESLHFNFPGVIISIDTYFASVAKAAVQAGASMVNDISGGQFDKNMLATVAGMHVPFVCTHHPSDDPADMHHHPAYTDVVKSVLDFLIFQTRRCTTAGINDVIIDPGIGFGKTIQENFRLINDLDKLAIIGKPLLLGVSRKGTIYRTLNTGPQEALNGTMVLNTIGLTKGAAILRVHDVKEAVEGITLTEALKTQRPAH
jgi:dihydropteroate synthase